MSNKQKELESLGFELYAGYFRYINKKSGFKLKLIYDLDWNLVFISIVFKYGYTYKSNKSTLSHYTIPRIKAIIEAFDITKEIVEQ